MVFRLPFVPLDGKRNFHGCFRSVDEVESRIMRVRVSVEVTAQGGSRCRPYAVAGVSSPVKPSTLK